MPKSKFSENLVRFQCTKCKRITHYSRKNKKTVEKKLEFDKYCKFCRAHTPHKETKKR